jgi:hypothetical protein
MYKRNIDVILATRPHHIIMKLLLTTILSSLETLSFGHLVERVQKLQERWLWLSEVDCINQAAWNECISENRFHSISVYEVFLSNK